ncbi:MAG: murein biosynthesis integral membrane protein MurJ [Candidatus Riflebacteria bacterium]|nr:murein biosynthesis integral membrane protein MurJ [Candidatus Riflebacteria bacterium]
MTEKPLIRSATIMSIATFFSRIAGLIREQAFAYFFGAGAWTDAFNIAFRIPNLLRDLFAEGAMSAAFVPTFNSFLKKEGKEKAFRLMGLTLNVLLMIVGFLSILGIIFSPEIVKLLAPGFADNKEKFDITVTMTRIMFPFLLVISWSAVAMGGLNSLGEFFVPAVAPVFLNLSMIFAGFTLCPLAAKAGYPEITGMAVGAMIGGFLQMAVQFPWLFRHGFKFQKELGFSDEGVRKIAWLIVPGTMGLAATQLNVAISTILATSQGDGAVSWLGYAFRLMQLPLGIFGVSVAQASLPVFSRQAADKDVEGMKNTFSSSLKLTAFINIFACLFLIVCAEPIIRLLFEHGRFTPSDTAATVDALRAYSIGLFTFSAVKVMAPAFYALNDPATPLKASIVTVIANISLNLLFIAPLGYKGLALATSLASLVNAAILYMSMSKKLPGLSEKGIMRSIAFAVVCSAFMAVGLHYFVVHSDQYFIGLCGKIAGSALTVSFSLIIGALFFFLLANIFRVEEAKKVTEILIKKISGKRK